jgi:NADPH-dependent curcumin reductase CurA
VFQAGGFILSSVVDRIALEGKIALCGAISLYNAIDPK